MQTLKQKLLSLSNTGKKIKILVRLQDGSEVWQTGAISYQHCKNDTFIFDNIDTDNYLRQELSFDDICNAEADNFVFANDQIFA